MTLTSKVARFTLVTCALMGGSANADDNTNQTVTFNLPSPSRPFGFDEVRAADGTTCRSSMAGNGAYLDIGGIGRQSSDSGSFDGGTVYGRVVIPLGARPGRIDCRSLYQLEIDRLKHELKLVRSGLGRGQNVSSNGNWQREGWNNQ